MSTKNMSLLERWEAEAGFDARAAARTAAIERGETVTPPTIKEWMEEHGIGTDEDTCYLHQESMGDEVLEEFTLSDGASIAFTFNSYVLSHGYGHMAGDRDHLADEQGEELVAEVNEMRRLRSA